MTAKRTESPLDQAASTALPAVLAELKRREWSKRTLAAEAGVPVPTVTRWINRERSLAWESVVRVLDALDLELDVQIAVRAKRPRQKER
jgi:plasmid maintenance system antidote protein VapI